MKKYSGETPQMDPKNMTVIGTQWGDEGKGKLVDWLSADFDAVVRFQGGDNAGHTVVVVNKQYVLSILPSVVLRKNKLAVIASGTVINPKGFLNEINRLREDGIEISQKNLVVADAATLVLDVHKRLDELFAKRDIGTTGRGIGPAYQDKIGRRAVRVADLAHLDRLRDHAQALADYHSPSFAAIGKPPPTASQILGELKTAAEILLPFSDRDWQVLERAKLRGDRILFEGAQGAMLDVGCGTYPFVTSSHTLPAYAALGSGAPPQSIGTVLGVSKAYATRVGNGCFPTELGDEIGRRLGEAGEEFGAVTGRRRRCGWLDLVMLRQVIKNGGINLLALTKLDVLGGLSELKLCTTYEGGGETIDYLPTSRFAQEALLPIYETMPGWQTSLAGITEFSRLPAAAKAYVRRIEGFCEVKVAVLSVGAAREQTFWVL